MDFLKNTSLALFSALTLTACVTPGPRQIGSDYGSQPPVAQYNGFRFYSIAPGTMSQDATRPHIRTVSDIQASDKLIRLYSDLSWKAYSAGDFDSFIVARSLALNMARARMAQSITTNVLTHSYMANEGNAVLPGSSVGFMPHKLYTEKSRRALSDIGDIQLSEMIDSAPSNSVQVASGPGFFGIPTMPAYGNQNRELQRQREQSGWGKDPRSILSMPVGSAYVATNKNGEKFIVENTPDGFLFYNNGQSPVRVNLEELDYFPVLDEPSPMRKKAAPIVHNMGQGLDSLGENLLRRGEYTGFAVATPPARIEITGWTETRRNIDQEGRITESKEANEKAKKAYQSNPAFAFAVKLMGFQRFEGTEQNKLRQQCVGGGRVPKIRYEGDALEYIRLSCLEYGGLIYTRRLIVTDDFKFKTMESIRNDQRVADQVKKVMDDGSLMESIASFVPGLGVVDSGMRCIGQESITGTVNKLYRHFYDGSNYRMGIEKFVEDVLPDNNDAGFVSKALDCSIAGGGFGKAAKTALASNPRYAEYAKSERLNKVVDTMSLFNQNFVGPGAGKAWGESFSIIDKNLGSGSSAGKLLKTVYETAQGSMGVTQLAEQLAGHQGLKALMQTWVR